MSRHDVFISYSIKDKTVADAVCNRLEGVGVRCWIAPRDMPAGMSWGSTLIEAIETSAVMVLILSANANLSVQVLREVERAVAKGLPILPFRIQEFVLAKDMEYFLSASHWLDAMTEPFEQHLDKLVPMVGALLEQRDDQTPENVGAWRHSGPVSSSPPEPTSPSPAQSAIYNDAPQGPGMVEIPAGSFVMGSLEGKTGAKGNEHPQHEVTISQPFAMSRYPVTFDEYDRFCRGALGLFRRRERPNDIGWGRGRQPVINVSWADAIAYCEWLSKKTGKPYRLPSEAEWEYACRARTSSTYWWGDDPGKNRANFSGSGSQWDGKQTSPVGSFDHNPFGLFDMLGNVFEWCQDCWHGNYNNAPRNGAAWEREDAGNCALRVVRGGSWSHETRFLRSAYRGWFTPVVRNNFLGFRLAQDL